MQELQCCGVTNSTDWWDVGVVTPSSCCPMAPALMVTNSCSPNSTDIYTQGCLTAMEDIFVDNFGYIAGRLYDSDMIFIVNKQYFVEAGILGLGVLELIGIIMSCYLGDRITRMKNYVKLP